MRVGLIQNILMGLGITALTAMGAGYVKHEAMLTGIERDISYIRENAKTQADLLNEIRNLLMERK